MNMEVLQLYDDYNSLNKKERKNFLKLIKTEYNEETYDELMELIESFK